MKKILLLLLLIATIISCEEIDPIVSHDVYVGGTPDRIGYWKNGSPVNVTSSFSGHGFGLDIFVKNDDVYVAGIQTLMSSDPECSLTFTGRYWKNDQVTNLTDSCYWSAANAIVVSDNNVYAAGYSTKFRNGPQTVTYWKNGIPTYLSDETDRFAEANDIAVVENTVYVVGHDKGIAKLWTNGVATDLWAGTVSQVKVINGKVYVVGTSVNNSDKEVATLWINGVKSSLSNGTVSERASGIAINGNDVYVCGARLVNASSSGYIYAAQYWKNGVLVPLPTTNNGYTTDIAVLDNVVYVVGTNNDFNATMWKNGEVITLPRGAAPSYATSVFVRKKS